MKLDLAPFNVSITDLRDPRIGLLKPVTSLDIFDGATSNLSEEGLFSIGIFGRPGDPLRSKQFGVIALKTTVFHPIVYKTIVRLKALYGGILNGTSYAKWDEVTKDFVSSDQLDGDTGFSFFMRYWKEIDFKRNESAFRNSRIDLIDKYKDNAMVDRILILPAGLRDIEKADDGRVVQDEVNELYRRAISIANTVATSTHFDSPILDNVRRNLQLVFNQIFFHFVNVLKGKRGMFQDKWGSRRLFNGTRNVITSIPTTSAKLGSKKSITVDDHVVGLFQHAKSIEPITIHLLKKGYLSQVFGDVETQALLVNPKTLRGEYVRVSTQTYDKWTSVEGLTKVLNTFGDLDIRHKPIMVDNHYLALIYRGEGNFRIFSNIEELPKQFNKEDVSPLTLAELIYLSGYTEWNKYPSTITRFPIERLGSTFVSRTYAKTTIKGEVRKELDSNWESMGDEFIAYEFPERDVPFISSLSPNILRLGGLGGDFDGDTCTKNTVYTLESMEEAERKFTEKETYLHPEGGFKTSINISPVELLLHNITG